MDLFENYDRRIETIEKVLKENNIIIREGSTKKGFWKIL